MKVSCAAGEFAPCWALGRGQTRVEMKTRGARMKDENRRCLNENTRLDGACEMGEGAGFFSAQCE